MRRTEARLSFESNLRLCRNDFQRDRAGPSGDRHALPRFVDPRQLILFDDRPAPPGLVYRAGFLSASEERALERRMAGLPFRPFEFQGFVGKRRTVPFGWAYRFDGSGLAPAEPIPDWLLPIRDRAARFAGVAADALEQALLIEYGEGAGLGWHRDRPVFGDVVGISLLAPAPLRFRRRQGERWERFTLTAEPRSAYMLRGPARSEWEHSIPPVAALRYSITFRTLVASRR